MKTLIISDIHSNIVALEEVWKRESDADLIVSAGDVVDCGPFPRECIDWMIDHNVMAVKGNHDKSVIREYDAEKQSPNWDAHNARLLDVHHIQYLRSLPNNFIVDINGIEHGIVHAYKDYDIIENVEDFKQFSKKTFGEHDEAIIKNIIFGHTHKWRHGLFNGIYRCLNPGSVSYRHGEEGKGMAYYISCEDGEYYIQSVEFPNDKLHQAVETADVCEAAKRAAYSWW